MTRYCRSEKHKKYIKGKSKQKRALNNNIKSADLFMPTGGLKGVDPVYALTNAFSKRFDALGKYYAGKMAQDNALEKNDSMQPTSEKDSSETEKRALNDSPEYVHSRRELDECQFADRFSSYAFRGGKLATAVMAGQGKQMFTVCLSRALGRSYQGGERQTKLLSGSAPERQVGNMSSSVRFNRDAQSAVSIVTDAVRGSSRLLELFEKLADDSGQLTDTPLEMNKIDTLRMTMPFLRTTDDRAAIISCRERLRELENDASPGAAQTARLLRSALVKQTAVLNRKEEQKRSFLTILSEVSRNVREAEKLFSSGGFAEQALNSAEELMEDLPPDDGKRRDAAYDVASAVSEFLSGLRGDELGAAQSADPAEQEKPPAGEEKER